MKNFLILTAIFATVTLMAQAPSIEWQKACGTSLYDYGQSVEQTSDGGYIMASNTAYYDGVFYIIELDICIYKLSNTGVIQWQKTIGGTDVDSVKSIKQTPDGGYILVGYTNSNDGDITEITEGRRAWVVKLNDIGEIQWQEKLGEGITINCIQLSNDGGYILAGNKSTTANPDCFVMKLSNTGAVEWQKTYGGNGQDWAYTIKPTADGGYILGGTIQGPGGDVAVYYGSYDVWMLKLSNLGIIEWQKTLGGMNGDAVRDVVQLTDGSYILACETSSNGIDVSGNHGNIDIWVVKLSVSGALQWQKTFGGWSIDIAYTIQKTIDGGYILVGSSSSDNGDITGSHGDYGDAWVIKISSTGLLQWQKALGGTSRDDGYTIQQTSDGGYIMVGSTFSNNGDVSGNHGNCDAWLVKLSAELATETFDSNAFILFPNPTNQFLNIQNLENEDIEKVTVSDLTGKILMEQSGNISPIYVQSLPEGIYFVQIQSQGKTYTQKFIKE